MARRARAAGLLLACLALPLAALLATPVQAQTAVTLVSNTGESTDSTERIVGPQSSSQNWVQAQEFHTGDATDGYTLTSVDAQLTSVGSSAVPRVSIHTANGNTPGTELYVLDNPSSVGSGTKTFTAPAMANLEPDTDYFVVFRATGTSTGSSYTYNLRQTESDAQTGETTAWGINNSLRSRNTNGGNWTTHSESLKVALKGYEGTNYAATGQPAISGTARVGNTLTAGRGTIADSDGLPTFPEDYTFQWVRIDSSDSETVISGATSREYTLVAADEGHTIKVKVTFTDNENNAEGPLESAATASVGAAINVAATGKPAIGGTAAVGNTLTANKGTIADDNGLPTFPGSFTFQWVRIDISEVETQISGATSRQYTLTDDDVGHTIKVAVSFTDDVGFAEGPLESNPTATVTIACSSANEEDLRLIGGDNAREGEVEICHNNQWRNVCDDLWEKVDANVACKQLGYTRGAEEATILSEFVSTTAVEFWLDEVECTGSETSLADCSHDGWGVHNCQFSERAGVRCLRNNAAATGQPEISGTARVGDTLTAGKGTIDDDDGLPSTFPDDYDFQWVRGSTDIPGATSHEYTLTDDDEGHAIKVTVSFTDNNGFAESRTSAATASVAAMPTNGCTPHDLRLVGGDNDREGEVEISRNNESGNVCDDLWDKTDADVACKQLGYTRGAQEETIHSEFVSTIAVKFWLDDVACTGSETSLAECPHAGWGVSNCQFSERAGVRCKANVNVAATGQPGISGTAVDGEVLTASTDGISDTNGKTKADDGDTGFAYTWQWFRVDSDGSSNKSELTGETAATYTLVAADVGKKVIVEASFTDDENNAEGPLASDAYPAGTDTVEAADMTPPTAESATVNGTTLAITFNEDLAAAANLANGAFEVKRTPPGEAEETVTLTGSPSIGGMTVTLTLDAAVIAGDAVTVSYTKPTTGTDNALEDAAGNEVADFTDLAVINDTEVVNNPATGVAIDGPAQVGMTLTAVTSGIADEDGLTGATFAYQWLSGGNEIPGETGATYTVRPEDLLKGLNVRVSFKDDLGNDEAPTSPGRRPTMPAAADHCDSLTVWCATLTAWSDDGASAGFLPGGRGSVSPPTFTHGGTTYTLTTLATDSNNGVTLATTPSLPADGAGLTLHLQNVVGERSAPLSGNYVQVSDEFYFSGFSLTSIFTDPSLRPTDVSLLQGATRDSPIFFGTLEGTNIGVRISRSVSAEAALDALTLTDLDGNAVALSPGFASGTVSYTASVGNHVYQVTVAARASDGNASVEYLDASDTTIVDADANTAGLQVALDAGTTRINVKVTAGATVETYSVTVTRAPCDGLWCATLTARDLGGGDRGCANSSPGNRCSSTDQLTGDAFRLDGTDYSVTELRDLASVAFRFGLSPGLAADAPSLVLEIGADTFRLPEADVQNADSWSWNLPRLDWSPGERVYLRLSEYQIGNEGELRLVPHPTDPQPDEGRLEVYHNGEWGTVCDDRWDNPGNIATEMACRFMGHETGEFLKDSGFPAAPESKPIWLDDVRCHRGSTHWIGHPPRELAHCYKSGWGLHNCTHEEDVVLRCGDEEDFTRSSQAPLTGQVQDAPDSHDGSTAFTFRILFSEEVDIEPDALRDDAVKVSHATVTAAARVDGRDDLWELTLIPKATQAISIQLRGNLACTQDGAICTADGKQLAANVTHSVAYAAPGTRGTRSPGLRASFENAPASHDGSSTFTVQLAFSEAVFDGTESFDRNARMRSAVSVTGGTLRGGRRVDPDAYDRWILRIEPDGNGDVTVSLPATTGGCGGTNAICTPGGTPLSEETTATIEGPDLSELTASFENVPGEHDGSSGFTFELAFSQAVFDGTESFNRNARIRNAVSLAGGTLTNFRRTNPTVYDRWTLRIRPSGHGDVTVSLPATTGGCSASGAICTPGGTPLSEGATATVQGPPGLSVADAEVQEGAGAALAFAITLSRASSSTVTVQAATSDGSAKAGDDYEAKSATETFAPGETSKVFSITVLDDDHNEDSETMTVTLSNPSGGNAYIADGTATGTITNDDPMPQAWLARFGRTVADQVIDAVEGRMTAARTPGTEVSLAGQRVGAAGAPEDGLEAREAEAGLERLTQWMRGAGGEEEASALTSRTVSGRELLSGTSFALTAGSAESGFGALWGRGAVSRFDGREGEVTLDGEVASALLGADFTLGWGTAGLVVAHSLGEGGYRSPNGGGEIESTLTGLYPWGRYAASERLSLWGVAGYGAGTLTLTPEGQAPIETDMALTMAALGGRGVLAEAPAEGGLELSVTSDALVVRTTSEAVRGSGGNLAASEADVTRLRLGLEGTWRGLRTLVPTLEVGARHDGGDAETGFGADIGGRLVWSDPALGIEAELAARGLLTHEDVSLSERGFAGSLAWDPSPDSERGAKLTLSQAVGAEATGGMDALLRPETARVLEAANEDGPDRRRLEARMGYGIALFGGGWTGVPEVGFGLTEASREYIHAWRLLEARDAGLVFGLDVEGVRNERLDGDAAPGHRVGLGFGWELVGARREDLELRFEASRLLPANDDPESRIGVRLTARW